jgi:hypothetical protein
MKRDMGLIRQILFKMEEHSEGFAPADFKIEGYTEKQIEYHIWLLGQANLMRVADVTTSGSSAPQSLPLSLTWEGHDFIDAARNDTIWSQTMKRVKSVGGSLSFSVLKQLLESLLKSQLGL